LILPDGNSHYLTFIGNVGPAQTFSFYSPIPFNLIPGTNYKFAVYCGYPYYSYFYSDFFEIIPPANPIITQFDGFIYQNYFMPNDITAISFASFGVTNVDVLLSLDNGVSWESTPLFSNYTVNDGINYLNLTMPEVETTYNDAKIKVIETGGALNVESYNFTLSNIRQFDITTPVLNTVWKIGSSESFTIFNNGTEAYIYSIDLFNGNFYVDDYYIGEYMPNGDNVYTIDLRQNLQPSNNYRLRYNFSYNSKGNSNNNNYYFSDLFTIEYPQNQIVSVTYPSDSEHSNKEFQTI